MLIGTTLESMSVFAPTLIQGTILDSIVTTPQIGRIGFGRGADSLSAKGAGFRNAPSIEHGGLGDGQGSRRCGWGVVIGPREGLGGSISRGDELATALGAHGGRGFGGQVSDEALDVTGQGLETDGELGGSPPPDP